jgi:hypothetical protein
MKIRTIVGVKLQPDQDPKTPVIHKVGGYSSGLNNRQEMGSTARRILFKFYRGA